MPEALVQTQRIYPGVFRATEPKLVARRRLSNAAEDALHVASIATSQFGDAINAHAAALQLEDHLPWSSADFQTRSFPKLGVELILGNNDPNCSEGRIRFDEENGWQIPKETDEIRSLYIPIPPRGEQVSVYDYKVTAWKSVSLQEAVESVWPFVIKAGKNRKSLNKEMDNNMAQDPFYYVLT